MKTTLLSLAMWLVIGRSVAADAEADVRLSADFTKPIRTLRGGIGASWHAIEAEIPTGVRHPVFAGPAHGGSAWGGNPPAEDHARWKQIERHADWLGLDFIRVEIEQRMWQPDRGGNGVSC